MSLNVVMIFILIQIRYFYANGAVGVVWNRALFRYGEESVRSVNF